MRDLMRSDQLTSDVLHRPEVQRQEEDNRDETPDKAIAVPTAQQVYKESQTSEDQVEKCDHWVFQSSCSRLVEAFKGAIIHEGTIAVIHVSVITKCRE